MVVDILKNFEHSIFNFKKGQQNVEVEKELGTKWVAEGKAKQVPQSELIQRFSPEGVEVEVKTDLVDIPVKKEKNDKAGLGK